MRLLYAIACRLQRNKIAGQRRRIARNVDHAWRIHTRKQTRHAISQTASRRVHYHQVGLREQLGEGCTIPGPTIFFELVQVLFGCGVNGLSINRQIVSKVANGCL